MARDNLPHGDTGIPGYVSVTVPPDPKARRNAHLRIMAGSRDATICHIPRHLLLP
jgi:hypothetical protein